MANEMDPRFVQGIRLLQSKSPDSAHQLYDLLQQILNERREKDGVEIKSKTGISMRKEAEKRLHEKKTEGSESGIDMKRLKLSEAEAEERRKEREKTEQARQKQEKDMEDEEDEEVEELEKDELEKQYDESTDEENSVAVDNFAMDLGLCCVICNQISMGLDATLIECQDCHKLYHKECHSPPITEEEVNDPRNVWYCCKCSKNNKKMMAKHSKSSKPGGLGKDSSTSKSSKAESSSSSGRKGNDKSSTSRESSSKVVLSGLDTLASVAAKSEPRPVPPSASRASSSSSSASSKPGSSSSKSSSQRAEQHGKGKGGKTEAESRGRVGGPGLSRSNSKQSVEDQVRQANKRMKQMKKKAKVQSQQKKEHIK